MKNSDYIIFVITWLTTNQKKDQKQKQKQKPNKANIP